jgi:hypothetical protein
MSEDIGKPAAGRQDCIAGRTLVFSPQSLSSGERQMSRISITFFAAAVVYALGGMVLGMYMGGSGDHTMAPVHAHINLLGWASLALMGAFYGLAGAQVPAKLAWANFGVSNLGNILTLPMVAVIQSGKPPNVPVLVGGELAIVGGMLLFGAAIVVVARATPAAAAPASSTVRKAA